MEAREPGGRTSREKSHSLVFKFLAGRLAPPGHPESRVLNCQSVVRVEELVHVCVEELVHVCMEVTVHTHTLCKSAMSAPPLTPLSSASSFSFQREVFTAPLKRRNVFGGAPSPQSVSSVSSLTPTLTSGQLGALSPRFLLGEATPEACGPRAALLRAPPACTESPGSCRSAPAAGRLSPHEATLQALRAGAARLFAVGGEGASAAVPAHGLSSGSSHVPRLFGALSPPLCEGQPCALCSAQGPTIACAGCDARACEDDARCCAACRQLFCRGCALRAGPQRGRGPRKGGAVQAVVRADLCAPCERLAVRVPLETAAAAPAGGAPRSTNPWRIAAAAAGARVGLPVGGAGLGAPTTGGAHAQEALGGDAEMS